MYMCMYLFILSEFKDSCEGSVIALRAETDLNRKKKIQLKHKKADLFSRIHRDHYENNTCLQKDDTANMIPNRNSY